MGSRMIAVSCCLLCCTVAISQVAPTYGNRPIDLLPKSHFAEPEDYMPWGERPATEFELALHLKDNFRVGDQGIERLCVIEARRPVLGIVGLPARREAYLGIAGDSAWRVANGERQAIQARPVPAADPIAVASRSHGDADTDAWLAAAGVCDCVRAGSAVKFCVLARGDADLYPRFGRTMEWDIAAGHALLEAAGGSVRTMDGGAFLYGKPDFENPGFIARGA